MARDYAVWLRLVDCELAFATGGMMRDDLGHIDWARAYARGYAPKDLAKYVTKALYNVA